MGRKKKIDTLEIKEDFIYVKGELFWRWKAMETEQRNIDLSLRVVRAEIVALLDKYPEVKEAFGHQANLVQQAVNVQQQYNEVIVEIGDNLNIDMAEVSIDDSTGRVFLHEAGASPKPIVKKNRK